MTTLVTPDAVEAAARAVYESEYEDALPWEDLEEDDRDEYRNLVRPVLAAAAPLIAQQALEDAANVPAWADKDAPEHIAFGQWLRDRAATLTPKEN